MGSGSESCWTVDKDRCSGGVHLVGFWEILEVFCLLWALADSDGENGWRSVSDRRRPFKTSVRAKAPDHFAYVWQAINAPRA